MSTVNLTWTPQHPISVLYRHLRAYRSLPWRHSSSLAQRRMASEHGEHDGNVMVGEQLGVGMYKLYSYSREGARRYCVVHAREAQWQSKLQLFKDTGMMRRVQCLEGQNCAASREERRGEERRRGHVVGARTQGKVQMTCAVRR